MSISPGCVGGWRIRRRSTARLDVESRVVVFTAHLPGLSGLKSKRDSVLIVDANAESACQGALQGFEPIAWRNPEVSDDSRRVPTSYRAHRSAAMRGSLANAVGSNARRCSGNVHIARTPDVPTWRRQTCRSNGSRDANALHASNAMFRPGPATRQKTAGDKTPSPQWQSGPTATHKTRRASVRRDGTASPMGKPLHHGKASTAGSADAGTRQGWSVCCYPGVVQAAPVRPAYPPASSWTPRAAPRRSASRSPRAGAPQTRARRASR